MGISLVDGFVDDRDYDFFNDAYKPVIVPVMSGYLPTAESVEEGVKGSLAGRVRLISQSAKQATCEIDGCIRAAAPSEAFRKTAVRHWEGENSSHKTWAWASVVLTAAGLGAAYVVSPWIAAASLAAAIYAGVQFHRMGKASEQMEKWREDPTQKLAMERRKAYQEGFSYVYHNDLKLGQRSHHAVLLPFEVEHVFKRYYDQTCVKLSAQRCVSNQQKKAWLDRFRTDNPISDTVLRYVYKEVPREYAPIARNFETIAASLNDVEGEFARIRSERKAESAQTIRNIESQRTLACLIPDGALHYKLSEAAAERDRQLSLHGEAQRRRIDREYESKRSQYYALYTAAILPINIYFDGKVKEARDALQSVLDAIAQQEADAFSPYYDYAQGIVAATAAAKNGTYVYTQQPFTAQAFHVPVMPKIEIHFTYQPPAGVDPSFWAQQQ